jgi:hypothetical protein
MRRVVFLIAAVPLIGSGVSAEDGKGCGRSRRGSDEGRQPLSRSIRRADPHERRRTIALIPAPVRGELMAHAKG